MFLSLRCRRLFLNPRDQHRDLQRLSLTVKSPLFAYEQLIPPTPRIPALQLSSPVQPKLAPNQTPEANPSARGTMHVALVDSKSDIETRLHATPTFPWFPPFSSLSFHLLIHSKSTEAKKHQCIKGFVVYSSVLREGRHVRVKCRRRI